MILLAAIALMTCLLIIFFVLNRMEKEFDVNKELKSLDSKRFNDNY